MHPQVAITVLGDALIDVDVVDAVLAMNNIAGIETLSSCQGNPGTIGPEKGGMYGHIAFRCLGGKADLWDFCAYTLATHFAEFIDDEVRIDIFVNSSPYAWLNFRNELLPLVTYRLIQISKMREAA